MHPDGLCLDKGGTESFVNGNRNEKTPFYVLINSIRTF